MTKKEAIKIILSDKKSYKKSLNYAVAYCQAAMGMDVDSHEFKIQVPYILNNITHWRHPKAKDVRVALRK